MNAERVDGRTLRYQHRRPELLAAATEYVLDHGFGDVSLRPIAHALGVTHATLLRHFSSKDELLLQVLEKIHADFQERLRTDAELRAADSTAAFVRIVWRRLCEPREQRQFVLLFELVGRTGREPDRGGRLVQSIINDWLLPVEERLGQEGWPPDEASTMSTLVLAQVRGLQLDLIMTRDRDRVDRAFESTVDLVARPRVR
ncbi:TetR/AcrR family transcriptional regulator [Rhodococcus sp. IEGM 1307]|uniref:TetR/AcrR family transcriptional regulator n=1 Tax=Rhodococcus sp. IEGM 1307 TaxID=3047091 RepID=UPI0024B80CCE|nr:TetR/AcrR family transcriptional regulator [Rhodococcus sp. IEGM 1307]MDI9976763.1 TetR/AcrR family transcriptional regulator [Rhodococcus sp. IEGM 1307]